MDGSDWARFVVPVIIFLIFMGVVFLNIHDQKVHIHGQLKKKGAKNIHVSWVLLDFDKDYNTYSIKYEDAEGIKHNTGCKIHRWRYEICWLEGEE